MSTITAEQVTKMHTYLLKHHDYHRESNSIGTSTCTTVKCGDNADGDDYADGQYRLQLQLLTLMLFRLPGAPELDELLSARHSDLKVYKCDLGSAQAANMPPMGDTGTGPNSILMVGYGPDGNGKDVVLSAWYNKDLNECCSSMSSKRILLVRDNGVDDKPKSCTSVLVSQAG